jgi:hypothetical protein
MIFLFRAGERFYYEYNFHVPWRHEIRLEQIISPTLGHQYPVCVGGARAGRPKSVAARTPFWPCASSTTRST